ncbi:LacI family DNA-binding transcriptional regulator [Marinimicrobium locisalis]|uniref:LacI family DNA-binding transcriptional regulator n=1 Tax=Marinimicrobium locisalis TaxID=546022 RepID=UPI0032216358
MRDVAERAGVSLMTVSRVLNNERVAAATRERVMEAVGALNYRLNISARSLSGTQSYVMGFFYDNALGNYISQYLIGVLKRCNELGYHLVLESCDYGEPDVASVVAELTERYRLDGMIIPPPLCEYLPLLDALDDAGICYVRLGPGLALSRSPYVSINDSLATFEITEHLIACGHRQIGFIKGDTRQGVALTRFEGFREAMAKHGLEVNPDLVAEGRFEFDDGMIACEKILDSGAPVTAILASNDDMASAVIAVLHRRGLRVPEDVAVAGFDDTSLATSVWPPLTTIRQPIDALSCQSVDLLIEAVKMDGPVGGNFQKCDILEHTLIVRGSTTGAV